MPHAPRIRNSASRPRRTTSSAPAFGPSTISAVAQASASAQVRATTVTEAGGDRHEDVGQRLGHARRALTWSMNLVALTRHAQRLVECRGEAPGAAALRADQKDGPGASRRMIATNICLKIRPVHRHRPPASGLSRSLQRVRRGRQRPNQYPPAFRPCPFVCGR